MTYPLLLLHKSLLLNFSCENVHAIDIFTFRRIIINMVYFVDYYYYIYAAI